MRIVLLQDDFPPEAKGGSAIVTATLARALVHFGHTVSVITTTQTSEHTGESVVAGVSVHRLYTAYPERWRAYRSLKNRDVLPEIKKLLEHLRPEIVHAHNIHQYLSYGVLPLAKQSGAKVIFTAHDALLYHYGKDSYPASFLKFLKIYKWRFNPFRQLYIRHFMRSVDVLVAVSEALARGLAKHGFFPQVIRNGIEPAHWHTSPEAVSAFKEKYGLMNKKIILFSGRVSGLKGAPQALAMMRIVKKQFSTAQLLVIGRSELPGAITTGWLSGDELPAAYGASEVVIVPSVYLDPFPTIALEAMAMSKPVVATCFGGAKEAVGDGKTGYVVNPHDSIQFAGKVIDLLENHDLADQMGEAGCNRVKEYFSAERMAHDYVTLYMMCIRK
jgi:glycosyltransferase involved in cell wall biosynthesis